MYSVQFSLSVMSNSLWPHEPQHTRPPCPPKPMSIELVMPSNHLILCRPLLLLPSIFPSIRVFSSESAFRIRWPKYWSFSFNISPTNEHPGLISFRMDWLDLLAVQGTLTSSYSKSLKVIKPPFLGKHCKFEPPHRNQLGTLMRIYWITTIYRYVSNEFNEYAINLE